MLPPWQRYPPASLSLGRRASRSCGESFKLQCRHFKQSCCGSLTCNCCKTEVRYSRLPTTVKDERHHDHIDDNHDRNCVDDSDDRVDSACGCTAKNSYWNQGRNKCSQWLDDAVDEKWLFGTSIWILAAGIAFLVLFTMLPSDAIKVSFRTQATFGTISQVLSTRVPISKWTIFITFFATPCVCAWIAMRNLIQRCYLDWNLWYPTK
jgi:hypothetical protein